MANPASGLSRLTWAMSALVVMIAGFTRLTNEPYRIINDHACDGWKGLDEKRDPRDLRLWRTRARRR